FVFFFLFVFLPLIYWIVSSGGAPVERPGLTCYPYNRKAYTISFPSPEERADPHFKTGHQRPRGQNGSATLQNGRRQSHGISHGSDAGRGLEFESQGCCGAASGAHPPPVHREGSGQGDDELLAPGLAALMIQQGRAPLLDGAIFGLEDQQPPGP